MLLIFEKKMAMGGLLSVIMIMGQSLFNSHLHSARDSSFFEPRSLNDERLNLTHFNISSLLCLYSGQILAGTPGY